MADSTVTCFVGCLIFIVLLIPGVFAGEPPAGIIRALAFRLPLLVLLLWMTLHGGSGLRRARGWKRLDIIDVVSIPVLIAITVGTAMVIPHRVAPIPEPGGSISLTASMVMFSLVMACIEELFFRSWLLSELAGSNRRCWAAVVSSMGFAALHYWQGWYGVIYAGGAGLLYSVFFLHRRNIVTLLISHALHNTLAILLSAER